MKATPYISAKAELVLLVLPILLVLLLPLLVVRPLLLPELAAHVAVGRVLVGVEAVPAHLPVVLVVQLLGVLARLPLGFLLVHPVLARRLREAVHFRAREAGHELFGELVRDGLAWKERKQCQLLK